MSFSRKVETSTVESDDNGALRNTNSPTDKSDNVLLNPSGITAPESSKIKVKKGENNSLVTLLTDVVEIVLFVGLVWFVLHFVLQNFRVEGSSMEPTLHSGEYLFVNKALYFHVDDTSPVFSFFPGQTSTSADQHKSTYLFHQPQHGDIIVFKYPGDLTKDYIKRVIALPGESVNIHPDPADKGINHVFVNGKSLNEPYISEAPNDTYPKENPYKQMVVPAGDVFVLGDNRNNSSDSRSWGMLDDNLIIGKAFVIYWPFQRWEFVPSAAADGY